ncbi:MAG TPA: nickel pincer cofactor biosynthesis protein LarB, partial [Candidatus Hydrogenedentes bacterium]|nr:nickel pincer cofactor biosynthesis protein LarB [Candidatus Hydrogenedentota bacterium]
MDETKLRALLGAVASGEVDIDVAVERFKGLPFEDLGFAKIDHHRMLRRGFPETVFCQGKTPDQVVEIVGRLRAHGDNVLATRCAPEAAKAIQQAHPEAVYHAAARAVTITVKPPETAPGFVAVVCAGTGDIPVAEEACVAAQSIGSRVERVYDVGVAGLHRLLGQTETLQQANALVVCAGMEGALASVVGGLVSKPVIAVPTSIGYGASFGGIAALLSM